MFTDLLGGQIDVGFATLPSVAAFLSGGKMRALAATSAKRSALLPDVPTFDEVGRQGLPGRRLVRRLCAGRHTTGCGCSNGMRHSSARQNRTTSRKRARAEGLLVTMDSPEDTTRIVRAEEAKWRRVVKRTVHQARVRLRDAMRCTHRDNGAYHERPSNLPADAGLSDLTQRLQRGMCPSTAGTSPGARWVKGPRWC